MGQTNSRIDSNSTSIPSSGGCPVPHAASPSPPDLAQPAKCPVDHTPPQKAAQCPVDHDAVNPLNQMPTLSQMPSQMQGIHLPTDRTESSIPRDSSSKWEYPSPQQFYNALVRKGWETPEEHVVTMVEIHNFLNEEAWEEVRKWERRHNCDEGLQLTRFKGRPGEISPKARFWMFAGWLLPSRFNSEPPFDRHDWIVRRPTTGEEVRYVIDYYSAPPEPDGSPVFSLDVRPAIDSFGSLADRIAVATEKVWANIRDNDKNPPGPSKL
ncbi:Cytochrome c heme lyase [Psilocybe cubensis]|uniref:Holocytochrome c-type synthase n=2 Tax=Psilocybe cubensis TaxID=181762 RepID=A0A8H8CI74_PSICU|nr:Cytochrome c heme lyase [Psilocybe cubensis]KAH9479419.1 Cytochrome c heme lyase [Psilocybe cubensis]